ncbi:MAG: hypothetical protein GKR96_04030 [Gammaproteobacteria bacterium]|nr:hypothetical protein [Gammaproteobacteria bacterium]
MTEVTHNNTDRLFNPENITLLYDAYRTQSKVDLDIANPSVIDLGPLTLANVTGPESEAFLQGQFSNDLGVLNINDCQLHGYCNPKGRALSLIRIMRKEEGFWLLIPQGISTQIINRLKMFKMRAKVDIELETQNFAFGLIGDTLSDVDLPSETLTYNVAGILTRKIAIAPQNEQTVSLLLAQKSRHQNSVSFLSHDAWRLIDILSGIPQVYAETLEEFIPQMINLDLVEGVSFKKGCYPGQEIVARLRYLGKLKQRMLIAHVSTNATISSGDPLFTHAKPDQKSGVVVDAINISNNEAMLTAMVPTAIFEQGDLMLNSVEGPTLTRRPLPYEIPADRQLGK